jgi:hypothetical protein
MGKHIVHGANATACHLACSTLATARLDDAFVAIEDHQLDTAKAAPGELAQQLDPEGLGLRGTSIHTKHFSAAVPVDGKPRRSPPPTHASALAHL